VSAGKGLALAERGPGGSRIDGPINSVEVTRSFASTSSGREKVDVDVLIVGAGPTGLTLAVDPVRREVDVALIEGAPALPRESRGKGLQPRALEVLDDLGAIDTILGTVKRGRTSRSIATVDALRGCPPVSPSRGRICRIRTS
jgi:NADPH-dependent 2,4-dienoyl-CoA reductase/sulfur reductase-like enzyme